MSEPFSRLRRSWERVNDALGVRPVALMVLVASGFLLIQLTGSAAGQFRVRAVGHAAEVAHAAPLRTTIAEVAVAAGDRIEPGQLLMRLSPEPVDRERAEVERGLEVVAAEARLASLQVQVDEETWLDPEVRSRRGRPSLGPAQRALHEARRAALEQRRDELESLRGALEVRAELAGIVLRVAPNGAGVDRGDELVSIVPARATEVVAYIASDTDPEAIAIGAPAWLEGAACSARGRVLRSGARVEEAPGQLRELSVLPVFGVPVFLTVPEGCSLGVGQVVTARFARQADAGSGARE